jgi:ATP-dependent phosphoenolpyruvate carboxykinase
VPDEILNPASQWKDGTAFSKTLQHLAELYSTNFGKYGDGAGFVSAEVAKKIWAAGPEASAAAKA